MAAETSPIKYKNFKVELSEKDGHHVATVKPLTDPVLRAGYSMGQSVTLSSRRTAGAALDEARAWIDSGALWSVGARGIPAG